MLEDRSSYVKRVLPDLDLIQEDLEASMVRLDWTTQGDVTLCRRSDFHIASAISRVKKLLEDLERAERATA